ncbi:glycosyltransferase family 2 protein [Sedimentibacter sp.]|uniref:glycosyltransferase family 2 protein n=1 Tax=Sedimentibacter sp. TaxID=1960295 RepID=UPI0028984B58|nr:glycosyltransferase family 2 protein [Sedimentibacter sp.]
MYISQCLIVKNEEENIEHCLGHIKSVVDEQIVVDTGSTDRTVELAEKMGAKVFHFEWIDDFSAARNFAIEKAKGDWIIFLDCDEYFSEGSVQKLKKYMKMWMRDKNIDGIMCQMVNIDKDKNPVTIANNISPRVFKNKKNLRYKNKIHEALRNSYKGNGNTNVGDASNNLIIYHTGYDKEIVMEKNKIDRNISMINSSIAENPEDAKMHYYLSNEYYRIDKYEDAIKSARESIACKTKGTDEFFHPLLYRNILSSMYDMSAPLEEIKREFDIAVVEYPEYPDYYFIMGITSLKENENGDAIEYLEKCIELCSIYKMNVESNSVAKIDSVYTALIKANAKADNKLRVVQLCTAVLNTNKYNYQILRALINTFLSAENEENIVDFFKKIYDYNNLKDKLYLLKASQENNNEKLVDLYKNLFTQDELSELENKE